MSKLDEFKIGDYVYVTSCPRGIQVGWHGRVIKLDDSGNGSNEFVRVRIYHPYQVEYSYRRYQLVPKEIWDSSLNKLLQE